jgi:hypothetical protein
MTTDLTSQTPTVCQPQTYTDKHRSVLSRVGLWPGSVLSRPGLRPIRLVLSVLVCVGLWQQVVSVAERPHFDSKGRDGAITVDGRYGDWYGNLQPLGSDPVSVQFLNDGEFLYVRLTASEAATRMQIMRQGMTAWFDPGGGTKKKFGIRYPVVERGGPDDQGRGGRAGGFGGGRGRRGGDEPPEESASPADRVDIIGPGKNDARSLTRDHLSGVEVAIRAEQGTLQYELKVPLARSADHPYALDTTPGKTIGFGLETAKMQQRSFGSERGGGFGGGGGGGMGGGGRGRGGGGGMGGRGGGGRGGGGERGVEPPKPLKSWATVTIAPVR